MRRRKLAAHSRKTVKEWLAGVLTRIRRKFLRRACDREIFSSCLLLKNLAVMKEDAPVSADYMLEQLKVNSFLLRRVYEDMLRDYRNGDYENACLKLKTEVGSRAAALFSHILSKMDQVNPAELVSYMHSFEESFEEERMTQAMKSNERKSLICTAASLAAVLAVLMNFTAVAVFMNMHDMLQNISMF
ncbi:MAG: hypothetical protein ACI4W2_01570 [Eubacterium sp.]